MDLTGNLSSSGNVFLKILPESNSYFLLCNYCETTTRFSNFDEFLRHATDVHGPNIGVSSVAIVPTEALLAEPTTDDAVVVARPSSLPAYDLRLVTPPCLVDVIRLLHQCLCIWHKPTRLRTDRRDRIRAYQLLLLKLRVGRPEAGFRDVRSVVRQLITSYFDEHTRTDAEREAEEEAEMEVEPGTGSGTEIPSPESEYPTSCRAVMDQLMFLGNADVRDVQELDIDTQCSFCSRGFHTVDALWTHMVNAHARSSKESASTVRVDLTEPKDSTEQVGCEWVEPEGPKDSMDRFNSVGGFKSTNRFNSKGRIDSTDRLHSAEQDDSGRVVDSSKRDSEAAVVETSQPLERTSRVLKRASRARPSRSASAHRSRSPSCVSSVTLATTGESEFFTESEWGRESDWGRDAGQRQRRERRRRQRRRHRRPGRRGGRTKREQSVDTDTSRLDKKPSTFFLSQYDDQFLEEFIDLYRQQECLWLATSPGYRNRKQRAAAYETLVDKYRRDRDALTPSVSKVRQLIRRMHGYYERLARPNANPYRSHIWQRLAFVAEGRRRTKRAVGPGGDTPSACFSSTTTTTATARSRTGPAEELEFSCPRCAKLFKRERFFRSHQLKAHPPVECAECAEDFGNADDLKKHMLWFHRKDPACPLCKSADAAVDWRSTQHLAAHFYDHTCACCSQVFHDAANYQRHRRHCGSRRRYKCWSCDGGFRSTLELRRHSREQHNDERPFKCSHCEISFKHSAPLAKHRRLHRRLNHC